MSTMMFAMMIGLTAFVLACSTDWLVAATDPFRSSSAKSGNAAATSRSKANRRPLKISKTGAARKMAARRKFQTELRELPFRC
jgi:hypothetical protein